VEGVGVDDGAASSTVGRRQEPYQRLGFLVLSGAADEAVRIGRARLAEAEREGETATVVKLRHAIGMALGHLRQWEPALAELAVAADTATRIEDPALQAVVWSTTAWTQARAGRPEDGLHEYARAHAVLEREPPSRATVVASVNLAMSALQLGLLDISQHWFDYAHANIGQLPDLVRTASVSANETLLDYEQGLTHEHDGRPGPARDWYERSARNGRRVRALIADVPVAAAEPWLLGVAVNQGCCLAKLGDPEEALRQLDTAMDGLDTQATLITQAAAYMGRAWAELATGDLDGCRRHGERAVRLADGIGWSRWQADTHLALARAAGLGGDRATCAAHRARAADLLAQLDWQARLRRLGVTVGLRAG
jgi:tetratricopeptide (TPR) repeat protein